MGSNSYFIVLFIVIVKNGVVESWKTASLFILAAIE